MTFKNKNMRTFLKTTVTVVVIAMAVVTCTSSAKEKDNDPKTKLEKLKKERSSLDEEIKKLEEQIAKTDTTASANKGKLVTTIQLVSQPFEHYIELQGHVDADNISYLMPRGIPAQVKAIYIKKGDIVRKGQLLAKLDDAVQLKQLQQLKTQLGYAQDIYNRQKNLWDQGIGTEVQLKNAENAVNSLKDQINTQETAWEMTNVRSEVDGYVEQLNLRAGETFAGFVGSVPQIMIVNSSSLKVVTEVPENYLESIHKGSPVEIRLPDVDLQFSSVISLMSQTIGLNTRSVTTEAKIPYNRNVHINQVAQVRIRDYSNPNAVTIPLTSLQTDENGKYVFIVSNEKGKKIARKKYVQVGQIYGDKVEVKQLEAGNQLITEGFQTLYDGQVVTTS